jgi:ornithine cyclodeaminase
VLVFDPETGRTIALLEGSSLTAIRTGAASGAAIDLLARQDSKVVTIFGAGAQARTQLEAACTVREIETAFIFAPHPDKAQALITEMNSRGLRTRDLRVARSAQEAVDMADIICTATTALRPVFQDKDLQAGAHISAVGSYRPDMQEVPAETLVRAKIFVDSRSAALEEAGDLIQPMQARLFDESHICGELGEVVLGRIPGRESQDEITYFKSVGIAVQDAMAAQVALTNARQMHLGTEADF